LIHYYVDRISVFDAAQPEKAVVAAFPRLANVSSHGTNHL